MFNMNLSKHGEHKNVIDGLNNKLIKILQEDELICCMNEAKVLVRPKVMMMYLSETPWVETPSRLFSELSLI
jgi:hypothetical protein